MATAGRPRSSALDPATRQQLDELDLLMQRMLALPVDSPEEPAPLSEPPDAAAADSTTAPSDQRASTSAVPDTPSAAFETSTPPQSRATDRNKQPAPGGRHRTHTLPLSAGFAASTPRTPAQSPLPVSLPASPRRLAWPLHPLLWINLVFDWSTGWLGPLSGWLREPGGRALIGWGGLLLLAAALAWLAWDGIGWTW
jgi:hypothetical protein